MDNKNSTFIDIVKNPVFLLAYLYLISICYHWGYYWNGFNIDVFSFYGIQDLAKGAAYAIPDVLYLITLVLVLPFFINIFLVKDSRKELDSFIENNLKVSRSIVSAGWILLLLIFVVIFYFAISKSYMTFKSVMPNDNNLLFRAILSYVMVIILSVLISFVLFRIVLLNIIFTKRVLITFSILTIIILPINAYFGGFNNSIIIKRRLAYDYIIINSKDKSKSGIFIFLGKIGDYYLLHRNDENLIVKTDSIQPLLIKHYSYDDSVSVNNLKLDQKKLISLASSDISSKPDTVKIHEKEHKMNTKNLHHGPPPHH